ncbi:NAD(P)-binding protein [Glonium stellatum]|uniref:NAD(P)-binding protein n=1 Tax=Glonium stellatum TaxID=574774 RepID=A0A8E2EQD8_9PEZI|nr:NAD(P)-binding protein [Glonium stellatum]
MPLVINFLAGVGAVAAAYALFCLFRAVHTYFLRPTSLARYLSDDAAHPSWALVTGSTDGIGLGFAKELCARGFNVLLHGRNHEKLLRIKSELMTAFPTRSVAIAVADASDFDQTSLYALVEQASNLPEGGRLRILVNNVGGAHHLIGKGIFHPLRDTNLDEVDKLINVNVRFPTRLTAALLPVLTRDVNTSLLIINMGSIAGITNMPYVVVYSATKAFNLAFSEALGKEMKAQGLAVKSLGFVIGSVDTPGAPKDSQGAILVTEPQHMAKACLDRSGCGQWVLAGIWSHWVLSILLKVTPEFVLIGKIKGLYLKQRKSK